MKKYINNRIQDLKFLWFYFVGYEKSRSEFDVYNDILEFNFNTFIKMYEISDILLNDLESKILKTWWVNRPNRIDPFEEYNDYLESFNDSKLQAKFYFSEIWKLENTNIYSTIQEKLKIARELESKYFFEDKEMLHRVIDVLINL